MRNRASAVLVTDGQRIALEGTSRHVERELRRLAGARIRAHGAFDAEPPNGRLRVDRYELLEIAGVVPRIGTLATLDLEGRSLLLFVSDDGRADALPEGWSKKLQDHLGSRLWIAGRRERSGRFVPSRFGILRPSGEPTPTPVSLDGTEPD